MPYVIRQLLVSHLYLLIDMNDLIIVEKRDGTLKEALRSVIVQTLNISWELNASYQISFTAQDDNSFAFAMLLPENIINFRGQQFVVKNASPSYDNGYHTISITATHIFTDVKRIFQHSKKDGTLTYSVSDVLSFYLDKNEYGYSYKVIGDFPKKQITDLGENNASDGLSQITSTWSNAVIYPNNKQIIVYTTESFSKNFQKRIGYGYNADNMNLQYDSTELVNQLTVVSSEKDDGSKYFPTHVVKDIDSIKKYGVWDGGDFSDDRYHDSESADKGARASFSLEPSISIDVDYIDSDEPIPGEIRRLEILESGFVTNVMVVSYSYYPLDPTQQTSITFNTNKKTVLDFQRSTKKELNTSSRESKIIAEKISKANEKLNIVLSDGVWYEYGGKDIDE